VPLVPGADGVKADAEGFCGLGGGLRGDLSAIVDAVGEEDEDLALRGRVLEAVEAGGNFPGSFHNVDVSANAMLRMANDTEFRLAAYVTPATWREAGGSRHWEASVRHRGSDNRGSFSTEVAPFGGVKESGTGREGFQVRILDYTELK